MVEREGYAYMLGPTFRRTCEVELRNSRPMYIGLLCSGETLFSCSHPPLVYKRFLTRA